MYTVYSMEGKIHFKCQRKYHFLRQCKNEQQENLSNYMQKQDIYDIPLYMTISGTLKLYVCKLELNGIRWEMEINTGFSSSLISEKQFNELLNARFSTKGSNTEIMDLFR